MMQYDVRRPLRRVRTLSTTTTYTVSSPQYTMFNTGGGLEGETRTQRHRQLMPTRSPGVGGTGGAIKITSCNTLCCNVTRSSSVIHM